MKRLVILGGGESGYGTAVLAKKQGYDVFLSDNGVISEKYAGKLSDAGINFEEGGHTEVLILNADEVVKSPGIPDTVPIVTKIRDAGIPVVSEIEFAGRYTKSRSVCITGSNGKTTTTTLIYNILKNAGYKVGLAGNIGNSYAYQIADGDNDWYVIELSSFQLDGMTEFKADIAVLMNITPDHLDRYDYDMKKYADSKMRITNNQGTEDYFIYCADDKNTVEQISGRELPMCLLPFSFEKPEGGTMLQGAYSEGEFFYAVSAGATLKMPLKDLKIKGRHNLYNAMAASLAAMAAGVDKDSITDTLSNYAGIEHRLEIVGEVNGVEYINDSKATNVDAVWYALESMEKPVVWIAGGTDKGNDYSMLDGLVKEKVKSLVCMGKDNDALLKHFTGMVPEIYDTHSLEEAMPMVLKSAGKGDVVLLSPACASFDLFANYEERGKLFKDWVRKLEIK